MHIKPYINKADSAIKNLFYDTRAEIMNKIVEISVALFILGSMGYAGIALIANQSALGLTGTNATIASMVITLVLIAIALVFIYFAIKQKGKK